MKNKTVNINLRLYRTKYGLSQADLAKELNVAERTYWSKERYGTFTQDEMIIILNYFKKYEPNITLDNIFLN